MYITLDNLLTFTLVIIGIVELVYIFAYKKK